MGTHTSQEQQTFQEWYCNLCKEKYVPTGSRQKYCLRCQKVKVKENKRRYNKRRYRREKIWNALENQLRALGIKPGDGFQVRLENDRFIVTRLSTSQPKE
jgi:hypothetical protein